ncbi:MAG TPA: carboxypeptidase-like regulatory domain-containing protein, partial [Puia sp.]|nr:carboxypeptidase-like regulatory domain-containing protein [Puia sp.]
MNALSFRFLHTFLILLSIGQLLSINGYSAVSKTTEPPGGGSLSGKVVEKGKGSPLEGASVYIPDLRAGAITDKDGSFKFNSLPSGTYLVEVRYVGYATVNQTVDLPKSTVLNV